MRRLAALWLFLGFGFFSAAAAAQMTLTASPTAVAVGGTVTATWSNVTSPSSGNALFVYIPGTSTWVTWRNTNNAAASGSVPIVLPTATPQGTYEVRLVNASNALLTTSNSFTVGPPVTVSGTTTASGAVVAGVTFAATNGGTCTTSNASGQYSCTVLQGWSGTITPTFPGFTLTPASRDYTNVAANTTAQTYDATSTSQITAAPTAVAVGGTVTATWSNVTSPSSGNALFVYIPGTSTWVTWRNTNNAAASGSVPIVLPTATPQGTYQLRLVNASNALLAIGNSFTVGPPVTVSGTTTASGAVVAGVTFAATNGGTCTTSNASGQYSCTVLQGWSGTITPTFPGFTLTPASRDYTNVAANTVTQDYDANSTSQIAAAPTAVAVGGTVTATWSNVTSPSSSNWIGLYNPGSGGQWSWRYTSNAGASGSAPFTLPTSIPQGTYQLRLFNASSALLAIGNSFTVGPPMTISGTVTASGAVVAGVTFAASNGGTCTTSDSAGHYSCTVLQGWTGTVTAGFPGFTLTPASRDYTNVAANTTAQTYDATSTSQITAAPTAVAMGGTVTASWSNVTSPSSSNWIGLFNPGSGGNWSWRYTNNAAASGSVPFTIPSSQPQGTYQLRLFNASSALLAISSSFTVAPPVTIGGAVTAGTGPLANVSFSAGTGSTCTTSNASGQYSCTVPQGWSGTLTPTLGSYSFVPSSRNYSGVSASLTSENYAAAYQVTGTVTAAGAAVAGVSFAATNGTTCTTSDASGQYRCTALYGWSGNISPSLSGYTLVPASRDYSNVTANQATQDYDAKLPSKLTGTVTSSGAPLANVAFNAGSGGVCAPSNASGQYSCTVPQNWSGSVTPTLAGYVFNPVNRNYNNVTVDQTLQDVAASPAYQLIGTVTSGGSPLAGVTIAATNGGECSTSNASGQYTCIVIQGWTGNVTPSYNGYAFSPLSRSYSAVAAGQSAQDYTALAAVQLTGTVSSGSAPTAGVTFSANNGGSCTPSNAAGQYSCNVPQGWTGAVTPSLVGYGFTPASRQYSTLADPQIAQDFAAANVGATTIYYIHPDHLNTPRLIADDGGNIVWRNDNTEPFGDSVVNGDPNNTGNTFEFNLRFPGQYFDRETSLHYNYHRDYDPITGRYIQSDPIGLNGGINLYQYANASPTRFVDPDGEFAQTAPAIIEIIAACVRALTVAAPVVIPGDTPPGPDERQRQWEHDDYKRRCDQRPPPWLTGCALLVWEYNKAKDCRDRRQKWDDKWSPGRHDVEITNWTNRINNLAARISRECCPACMAPPR